MVVSGSRRILIADNDEDVLIALERTLETEGYDTSLAFDAEGIYRTLSNSPFDLVVLDDYLSDKDSFEVLAHFHTAGIWRPVVVTHHRCPTPEDQERLRSLGASAFINKRAHSEHVHIVRFLLQLQRGGEDEFGSFT